MKFVFVSNYFNHHQRPFCEKMYELLSDDFVFISTSVMRDERRKLGYTEGNYPKYVLLSYENEEKRQEANYLINEADVVIAGSCPNDMLVKRIRNGKLLFRYSERPYKKEASVLKKIYHAFLFRQKNLWKNNIYMLCAGEYTAIDYKSLFMYKNRTYKWGYFPETKEHNIDKLLSEKKKNVLLWCGRFIDWKHPDDAIKIAEKLKENGNDFKLRLIGTGVMESKLKELTEKLNLTDCVEFVGSMSPNDVRLNMEKAGIYLITSDSQEGWGAVLNEAMNSGCAVVSSDKIGSASYLLSNGKNGFTYEPHDIDMLYSKVKFLLDNPEMQNQIGKNAYYTVINLWNSEIAAERILKLSKSLLNGEEYPELYEQGPCSN